MAKTFYKSFAELRDNFNKFKTQTNDELTQKASKSDIPMYTSQLINDSGFITDGGATGSDPYVRGFKYDGSNISISNIADKDNYGEGEEIMLSGSSNIIIGQKWSIDKQPYGTDNVCIGKYAGDEISYGSNNVFIGSLAGEFLANGNNNFAIGYNSGPTSLISMSNVGYLGDNQTRTIYSNVAAFTSLSDARTKEDIQPADLDICWDNIKKLPLVYFKYKDECSSRNDKHILWWLAQDAEKVFPKSVTEMPQAFDMLDENGEPITIMTVDENGEEKVVKQQYIIEDCKSFTPDQILPTLFGAMQKAISKIETLEETVVIQQKNFNEQQKQIEELQKQIDVLKGVE